MLGVRQAEEVYRPVFLDPTAIARRVTELTGASRRVSGSS
jgi:hypothetical protein